MCLIALIPGLGELQMIEGEGVQKVGTLSTSNDSIGSWVLIHNASTHGVSKMNDTIE